MRVGDQPEVIVGWVLPEPGTVQELLRAVAAEMDEIERERAEET